MAVSFQGDNMASIFNIIPTKGISANTKPRILKAQFGDGYVEMVGDGINNINEEWSLSVDGVSDATAAAIDSFLTDHIATYFLWTPPNRPQARYTCEEWSATYNEDDSNSVSAKFKRYFG